MQKNIFLLIIAVTAFCMTEECQQTTTSVSNTELVETRDETNNQVKERFFRRKNDFAKEGLLERFDSQGKIIESAVYKNDKMEGEHKFYFSNGTVESVEYYRDGVIDGDYLKYYENGTLALKQVFKAGILEGESLAWYPNGVLRERVTMAENEENGPFAEWHPNGMPKAIGTYKTPKEETEVEENKEDGPLFIFDSTGQCERIMDCVQGRCHTKWSKK